MTIEAGEVASSADRTTSQDFAEAITERSDVLGSIDCLIQEITVHDKYMNSELHARKSGTAGLRIAICHTKIEGPPWIVCDWPPEPCV